MSGYAPMLRRTPVLLSARALLPIGVAATLMAWSAFAQADTLKYYRHLVFRESPVEDFKGRQEIDAGAAKALLHHRFRFDEQGRVTEIVRAVGERLTRNEGSFSGFLWWAPAVRIEYAPGKEIRSFYNEAGDRIAAHGAVWRMEFSLDAQGRRSALNYFGKDGQPVDGAWGIQRYEWERPAPGVIIEARFNRRGESAPVRPDFLFHRVRLEFGHEDLLDFIVHVDAKGDIADSPTGAAVDRISYDPWGNFQRWQVYNRQRQPHNGNAPDVAMGEHVHDGLGQARLLRGFGPQGEERAMAGLQGPMRFEYDEHGNLLRQQLLNMNGELVQESRLAYSADGSRLLMVRYLDAQGRPTSPAGLPPALAGLVAQQFQYDDRGLRKGVQNLGVDQKPLPPPAAPPAS